MGARGIDDPCRTPRRTPPRTVPASTCLRKETNQPWEALKLENLAPRILSFCPHPERQRQRRRLAMADPFGARASRGGQPAERQTLARDFQPAGASDVGLRRVVLPPRGRHPHARRTSQQLHLHSTLCPATSWARVRVCFPRGVIRGWRRTPHFISACTLNSSRNRPPNRGRLATARRMALRRDASHLLTRATPRVASYFR